MPTPLHPGLSDPAEVSTYVDGECHYFALALHHLKGLTPAYVANRQPDGQLAVGHVVVVVDAERVADAEGIWARADLLEQWGAGEIVDTTPEAIARDLGGRGGRLSGHAERRIGRAQRRIEADGYLERLDTALAPHGPGAR